MRAYLYALATDKRTGAFDACVKAALFFLSLIYGAVVSVLIFVKRAFAVRVGCAVVSVGNVTVGGTGKTPLVELVAGFLRDQGHRVAIISRGYGKRTGQAADEPLMLAGRLKGIPLIVDPDRARAVRTAIKENAIDTALFDDGLQQWHIKKDLEIVTIDAGNPFGNGCLLPRGILRQPLATLARADVFVITKANIGSLAGMARQRLQKINPGAAIFDAEHKAAGFYKLGQPRALGAVSGLMKKRVFLFSGIADPESFVFLIRESGAAVAGHQKFPDHYRYRREDVDEIIRQARAGQADLIVTTEKDAVKLSFLNQMRLDIEVGVLCIELKLKDEHGFFNRLRSLYSL